MNKEIITVSGDNTAASKMMLFKNLSVRKCKQFLNTSLCLLKTLFLKISIN